MLNRRIKSQKRQEIGNDNMSVVLTEIFGVGVGGPGAVVCWKRGREISGTRAHRRVPDLGSPPVSTPLGAWVVAVQPEGGSPGP